MDNHLLALAAAASMVFAIPAGANVCTVPGTTEQWVTDRCMAENDTDDPHNSVVQKCIRRIVAIAQACEWNVDQKSAYCELLLKKGKIKGSIETCVSDPNVVGPSVKQGLLRP